MTGILDIFLPREKKFFDMLEALSANIVDGSGRFLNFVHRYNTLSPSAKQDFVREMKEVEHACDSITHRLSVELNSTFITPFDREDLHHLSRLLDDVIDIFYNLAEKLSLYNIKKLPKFLNELAEISNEAVLDLQPLLYAVRSKKKIESYLQKIHAIERKSDSVRNTALARLFANSTSPVDIIKFKDIYESMDRVTDKIEDVADVVENIVIKHG